jgi:peptidyl-prolyl cis-trans isomerase D
MLSTMRKHAGSWIIKFLLGAIIVVFIPWGVGRYRSQRSSRVAEVNGTIITLEDYRVSYNNLIEQVRQTFGNNLNDDLIKTLRLRQRALDQLIDQVLMLQAADKLSLRISDEELAESIRNIRAFHTAGEFDSRRYITALNRSKLTPEEFEVQQRDALLIDKLRSFIAGNLKVSDQEAFQWYTWDNTEIDIDYVIIEPERYTNIAPTDDEIRDYFERNKESYKTDPKIKVRYLHFKPQDYAADITVSDDDVRNYYETNPDKFKTPKTVEARHILIKVDQNAEAEEVSEARQKIEKILKMAQEGHDFAELAKQYSEGPTKDKGGYLGTFPKEAMVKPFADQAFSMKAGEISEPVRTRFGWHIIKVEKINPATTRSLSDAKNEIYNALRDDRSKNLAYDEAEAVYDAAFEDKDLEIIADERKLKLLTTDFFTQKSPPEGISNSRRFASVAFNLPVNEIGEIQDFEDGYYLIQVIDKFESQVPELEAVKAKVKSDVIKAKQDEKAREDANALLTKLGTDKDFDAVVKEFKLAPKKTGFFKRNDSIPTIGNETSITRAAFRLSDNNTFAKEVIKGQKGYYVIRFRERREPSSEGFEKQKQQIKQRLLQQKTFQTFDAWLNHLKNNSQISIEDRFVKS